MDFLDKILPDNDKARKWVSIFISVIVAGLLTLWGIYGIGEYGIALFILTPLFIGAVPVILYGYKKQISRQEALKTGLLALGIYTMGLFVFAMEGLICIAMVSPIAITLSIAGSYIGFALIRNAPSKSMISILILVSLIPFTAFIENKTEPELSKVVTSVVINADRKTVWNNVIAFPELNDPSELIFKAGIAYPTNATIEGSGVGAIRYCNFSTGSFVEPITVWEEHRVLQFDVKQQPKPMQEVSFWDINAPHLNDYFVSQQGKFELVELENGKTKLIGTTWYTNRIKPEFYWQIWSNIIIHKIHERVLRHIKVTSEQVNN